MVNYKYVLTMDADNEHKTTYIDNFKKLAKNPTIVIGNRDKKNRFLEIIFEFYLKLNIILMILLVDLSYIKLNLLVKQIKLKMILFVLIYCVNVC